MLAADDRTFTLELPAANEHLVVARLFVAAAATEFGCGEQTSEDFKLAVTEAAGALTGGELGIRVTVSGHAGTVRVTVASDGTPSLTAVDGELVLGLELARALLGDLSVATTEAGTEISFVVADC